MATVLEVKNVSKKFIIYPDRPITLKQFFIHGLTGRFEAGKPLWALRDVSFSLDRGRSLGIIGHNGSGKSTLLRLICGLGRATEGSISHNGIIGSMLELGSGFHPDMTGRENLMTGGILSGLSKKQVRQKAPMIISFSELEEFIDHPVRTYSNGMYLRLAFATAMVFDPDFVVIDEIISVGDIRFQQKCFDFLHDLRHAGKSLILVSHDLDQVRNLCDEVLVLEEGTVVMHGDPETSVRCYHELMRQRTEKRAAELSLDLTSVPAGSQSNNRIGTHEATIQSVHFYDTVGNPTDSVTSRDGIAVRLEYSLHKTMSDLALIFGIYTEANVKCFETTVPSFITRFGAMSKRGTILCDIDSLPLRAGRYYVNVGLYPTDWDYVYDYHWQLHPLTVVNREGSVTETSGIIAVNHTWSHSLPE